MAWRLFGELVVIQLLIDSSARTSTTVLKRDTSGYRFP